MWPYRCPIHPPSHCRMMVPTMSETEIRALIILIDDPDEGVYNQVREAEVITRDLQGLANGAVAQSEFREVVEAELQRVTPGLTNEAGTRMLATCTQLLNAWDQVAEGAALELRWG